MELWLIDTNLALVEAWSETFTKFDKVHIRQGDILDIAENAIVSPANGYGFMDGGIDRLYTEFFGLNPQKHLQQAIMHRPEGYLPVGTGIIVHTGHARIPYMICTPTMLLPEPVPAHNSFYALTAVLNIAYRHANVIKKVFCPGLGTGIGCVPPELAAKEMADAYRKWRLRMEK
jgi:O-acetyl-ADP-ribose deacetylase (regulator of RNase III)